MVNMFKLRKMRKTDSNGSKNRTNDSVEPVVAEPIREVPQPPPAPAETAAPPVPTDLAPRTEQERIERLKAELLSDPSLLCDAEEIEKELASAAPPVVEQPQLESIADILNRKKAEMATRPQPPATASPAVIKPEMPARSEPESGAPAAESDAEIVSKTVDLVTFILDKRKFGVDIQYVQSVVRCSEITRVPHVVNYVLGVMNLRGIITPIFDLRVRFEIGATSITEKSRIIIMMFDNQSVGFLVDGVSNIYHIPHESIKPPPGLIAGFDLKYIKGVVKLEEHSSLLMLLDLHKIIRGADISRL